MFSKSTAESAAQATRVSPAPRFVESAEQNGERIPPNEISRIEPLNLRSRGGREERR
jgi:hypothetical protein